MLIMLIYMYIMYIMDLNHKFFKTFIFNYIIWKFINTIFFNIY